jgi:hypothetical protein
MRKKKVIRKTFVLQTGAHTSVLFTASKIIRRGSLGTGK